MHSETGPLRQNQIQRTVRTAHLSVLMTVRNFSTQYNKAVIITTNKHIFILPTGF